MAQSVRWVLCAVALLSAARAGSGALRELLAWKQVDFAYPSAEARADALRSGAFVPEHNVPLGLDVSGDRLFVTVPRWRHGVAATLNEVRLTDEIMKSETPSAPLLKPFPSWEANTLPPAPAEGEAKGEGEGAAAAAPPGPVSVFRVRADACGRLWVLDTGVDDMLGSARRVAPARLLVYDLRRNDSLARTFALPHDQVKPDSLWAHIAVDVTRDTCDRAYAYLSDVGAMGLVVYSWADDASWRVEHHFFHFDPLEGNLRVGGVDFQWMDGVFGVALSAPDADGDRTVYFHPLSSTHEFSVAASTWRNRSAADNYYAYKVLGSRGELSHSTASFVHEPSGVLFYTLISRDGIGCWNTNKAFSTEAQGLVAQDHEALNFPNDLKVCGGGNLWVLSNRIANFLYDKLDPDQVNFRVFRQPAPDAVKGTVCEPVAEPKPAE